MKRALIIMADGFEEIEAIAVVDVLRRAALDVVMATINTPQVTGAHGVVVSTDCHIDEVKNQEFDVLILPGGPGVAKLEENLEVKERIVRQHTAEKLVAAICAAPRILDAMGILEDRLATSWPGTKDEMQNCKYITDAVVKSGHIITSRGPATAMAFAFSILEALGLRQDAATLKDAMLFAAYAPHR
ncbi:MAG: DJ-1/PfpI family protein [bacterium]|nr:DJ-1/PfpI family protein [bacterium]